MFHGVSEDFTKNIEREAEKKYTFTRMHSI